MYRADLPQTSANSARFLLELAPGAGASGTSASYRVQIATADTTFDGTASLRDDGSVELAIAGAGEALVGKLQMFAKLVARGAAKRREEGMPVWPARITRWRPTGDEP
jgi:hypothetical protein